MVEKIWSGQSVLSAWEDLYDLTFVRWDKHQEWSPWNCILLTKDEAASHVRLVDLDEVSLIHTSYYYCENKLWCNFLFYIEKSVFRMFTTFKCHNLFDLGNKCFKTNSNSPNNSTVNLHSDRSNTMDGSN